MKTRSNMPLFVLEVSDVKALSNSQIDLLRCGDWLVKKDASGEHPYQVTFKKEGVGMCLTYHDASVIETQSYDWNNSLKKWVYNSEDKTPNLLDAQTEDDVEGIVEDLVEGGTLDNAKPIYFHGLDIYSINNSVQCHILNNSASEIDTIAKFKAWAEGITGNVLVPLTGRIEINNTACIALFIKKNADNTYIVRGLDTSHAFVQDNDANLSDYFTMMDDYCNKIN